MFDQLRFLLLQVRVPDDPMAGHEVQCFARVLDCSPERIAMFDLLGGVPTRHELDSIDIVLLGGSGDYSVAEGGDWMTPVLEAMRELHDWNKPTFASCWGFQAMAAALGGTVVTDLNRAELGSLPLHLTEAGRNDSVFGPLADVGATFPGLAGHQDIVDTLPPDAVCLVSSEKVANQAFTFPSKPIYCTQFHPELTRNTLLDRLRHYPKYVESIAGMPYEKFEKTVVDATATEQLLPRFVHQVMG